MKVRDILVEAPSAYSINTTIRKNSKDWKEVGTGASASVWVHAENPDVAVKVIGGGEYDLDELNKSERLCALAFVEFCVHEGTSAHPSDEWRNHYPNILGINTDDEDVFQIKMETLKSIKDGVGDDLDYLARRVARGETNLKLFELDFPDLMKFIKKNKKNTLENIVTAIQHLNKSRGEYGKRHKIRLKMDLHGGNWLQSATGVLVAVDPWFGRS